MPRVGIDKVTTLLLGLRKSMLSQSPPMLPEIARVNGWDALALRFPDGRVNTVMTIETDGCAIYAIRSVVNPDKLAGSTLAEFCVQPLTAPTVRPFSMRSLKIM